MTVVVRGGGAHRGLFVEISKPGLERRKGPETTQVQAEEEVPPLRMQSCHSSPVTVDANTPSIATCADLHLRAKGSSPGIQSN